MRRLWAFPFALVLAFAPLVSGGFEGIRPAITSVRPTPPQADRKPARFNIHGIERVDNYAWMRDSKWRKVLQDPSVLSLAIRAHIEAENRYAEAVLAPLSGLRNKLVEELKGRINPDDSE